MEARGKKVEDWFSVVSQAQVMLPRFQRHEAWNPNQISGVLENILRDPPLPIGALLVLEIGDEEPFLSRPLAGAPNAASRPQFHLLDGQQRMTALWRSLNGIYENFDVFVSIKDPANPSVEVVKRWDRKGVRQPVWADHPDQMLARDLMPANVLCPGQGGEDRLQDWIAKATDGDTQEAMRLVQLGAKLRSRIANYVIPFLALPVGTDADTALDVFVKMNTSATPLNDFDIVVAQLEQAAGQSMHDLVDELLDTVPGARDFGNVESFVLSVSALCQGMAPLKKNFLDKEFTKGFMGTWGRVKAGFDRGLSFLREEGFVHEKFLPTEVIVYLACALWADVAEHGYDDEGRARSIIRKAVWRAAFTNRYLKTATTRAYADFKAISALIADPETDAWPELFDEEFNPLPDRHELLTAGWPSRKDRLPRAILAASLSAGALDFADGARIGSGNALRREYHHIFPVHLLGDDRDNPEARANRALNCALVTWKTNRKIAATTPAEYIKARTKAAELGEREVRHRLATHLVPYDELIAADYDAFLHERAEKIAVAMKKLCSGLPVHAED